jgi:UDP-glucose 4-epimerase
MPFELNRSALVLGANGYIGQNLCGYLIQQGFAVTAVGRQPIWKGHVAQGPMPEYHPIDLGDKHQVARLSFDADLVFMMAGITGTTAGFTHYDPMVMSNEMALLHVLSTMTEQQSRARLVFPGTRLVYKGQAGKLLAEDAEKETKTVYAVNKLACEGYIHAWANAFDLQATIFRICVPYGHLLPGQYSFGTLGFMRSQAMQKKQITLFGDGSMRRTFTHVHDICRIMTHAALLPQTAGGVYNIGGPDHLSLRELAEQVAAKTGSSIAFHPWPALDARIESGDTMFDDQALQNAVPFRYHYTLANYIAGW